MKNRKNVGFTLIEAVVAFAVLGIAVFGIGGFFVSASRSYSNVSDETSLQYEAQLTLNQVENMLIDSTLGVSYNYITSEDGDDPSTSSYKFVKNDSEASGEAVAKVLYAYNVNENDLNSLDVMLLKWVADKEEIYYKVIQVGNSGGVKDINVNGSSGDWELLAENVVTFSVDLSAYAETKKVEITLGFKNRSKDYQTTGTVVLRNDVLINADEIAKIYSRISKGVKTVIDGVVLTTYNNIYDTVPGGSVQLVTKISGQGYLDDKKIDKWIVKAPSTTGDGKVLYNSASSENDLKTRIDGENQVLHISPDIAADVSGAGGWNETVVVEVYVKKDEGTYVSDSKAINIKFISNIELSVKVDKDLPENKSLKEDTEWVQPSPYTLIQKNQGGDCPTVVLHPKNIAEFQYKIYASGSFEGGIQWSIEDRDEGVKASIVETSVIDKKTGTVKIKIDPSSQPGGFRVCARLRNATTVYVDYMVRVEYPSQESATLEIVIPDKKTSVNRGGKFACGLKLAGETITNYSDYDWSVSVSRMDGQEITGNAVSVNEQGEVSVNYDLSYDYAYNISISARSKDNPNISAKKTITVPKVSLQISPSIIYNREMGDKVSGITCTANGLENYEIDWKMAKSSNPTYFFTAAQSYYITGSKNDQGEAVATVALGEKGDPKTNCTVKAYLRGNTNCNATMKISTESVDMGIRGTDTVRRSFSNGSIVIDDLVVYVDSNNLGISVSNDKVKWEIADVTTSANGSIMSDIDNTKFSVNEKGVVTIDGDFAQKYKGVEVVITVSAYCQEYNLTAVKDITVKPLKFNIYPKNILIPDGSSASDDIYYYAESGGQTVKASGWVVLSNNTNITIEDSRDGKGKLNLPDNRLEQSDNETLTIQIREYNDENAVLRFGFENNKNGDPDSFMSGDLNPKTSTFNYSRKRFIRYKSRYTGVNGEYICYVSYQQRSSKYESWGNATYYAFVSNESSTIRGTWYQADVDSSRNIISWEKLYKSPDDWKDIYF